jgi:hypothetical protein
MLLKAAEVTLNVAWPLIDPTLAETVYEPSAVSVTTPAETVPALTLQDGDIETELPYWSTPAAVKLTACPAATELGPLTVMLLKAAEVTLKIVWPTTDPAVA